LTKRSDHLKQEEKKNKKIKLVTTLEVLGKKLEGPSLAKGLRGFERGAKQAKKKKKRPIT